MQLGRKQWAGAAWLEHRQIVGAGPVLVAHPQAHQTGRRKMLLALRIPFGGHQDRSFSARSWGVASRLSQQLESEHLKTDLSRLSGQLWTQSLPQEGVHTRARGRWLLRQWVQ